MIADQKISVLLLVCNEVNTIERDIISIKKNLQNFINYELVIMQDGSTDGTYEKLNILKKKYDFKLNSVIEKRGYTSAFVLGIKECKESTIFFSDTGGKYDFKNLKIFIETFFSQKLDLLAGYRVKRKDKIHRRILTFLYTLCINILFKKKYLDYDCGFKIFKKEIIESLLRKHNFTSYLLTSQIFIYFFLNKLKIFQLPVEYLEDSKRSSRGIPLKKIPKIIILSLINLIKIRYRN